MRKTLDVTTLEYASYPQRIAARAIDTVLQGLLLVAFLKLVHADIDFEAISQGKESSFGMWVYWALLFNIAYEVPITAQRGMTIGKRLMGICVVRTDGLIGIGLDRAIIRFMVPVISGIIPFIGPIAVQLWFFFDPKRQNIPDKAARTFVVRAPKDLRHEEVTENNIEN